MAKKIVGIIKLQIGAQSATPQPPIGPALGQHQVNIMGFCKAFNAMTQSLEKGLTVPTVIIYKPSGRIKHPVIPPSLAFTSKLFVKESVERS